MIKPLTTIAQLLETDSQVIIVLARPDIKIGEQICDMLDYLNCRTGNKTILYMAGCLQSEHEQSLEFFDEEIFVNVLEELEQLIVEHIQDNPNNEHWQYSGENEVFFLRNTNGRISFYSNQIDSRIRNDKDVTVYSYFEDLIRRANRQGFVNLG